MLICILSRHTTFRQFINTCPWAFRQDTSLGILVNEAAYWALVELQLIITMGIMNSLDCYMTLPFKLG